MTEIGLGRVGIVLSMDASRLSRRNIDWYRLWNFVRCSEP